MLVSVSTLSSRQSSRRMRIGVFITNVAASSTGRPSHIDSVRNDSGGKSVMADFITGQLKPQASVSATSRPSCERVSAKARGGVGEASSSAA